VFEGVGVGANHSRPMVMVRSRLGTSSASTVVDLRPSSRDANQLADKLTTIDVESVTRMRSQTVYCWESDRCREGSVGVGVGGGRTTSNKETSQERRAKRDEPRRAASSSHSLTPMKVIMD